MHFLFLSKRLTLVGGGGVKIKRTPIVGILLFHLPSILEKTRTPF